MKTEIKIVKKDLKRDKNRNMKIMIATNMEIMMNMKIKMTMEMGKEIEVKPRSW